MVARWPIGAKYGISLPWGLIILIIINEETSGIVQIRLGWLLVEITRRDLRVSTARELSVTTLLKYATTTLHLWWIKLTNPTEFKIPGFDNEFLFFTLLRIFMSQILFVYLFDRHSSSYVSFLKILLKEISYTEPSWQN